MINRTQYILALMALVAAAPNALSQYSSRDGNCATGRCGISNPGGSAYSSPLNDYATSSPYHTTDYGDRSDRNTDRRSQMPGYSNGLVGLRNEYRDRYNEERNRLTRGYDYRAPLNSAVEDTFRTPLSYDTNNYGGISQSGYDRGRDLHNSYENRGRLPDPFRLPSQQDDLYRQPYRNAPLTRNDRAGIDYQSRYRIPLDRVDYSNDRYDYRPVQSGRDRLDFLNSNNDYRAQPLPPNSRPQPGVDPFTPPLPRRDTGNEAEAVFKAITARYSNPVNVRAVGSMTSNQALALYREVSQQTDQRHLEPSSYDLRVRRGLRNLGMALENPAFTKSLGIQVDSFRLDGFRTTLSRVADSMRVASYSDAQAVVQSVMQEAQTVPGLGPNVVAFEFANATVDTLDKFSALEPAEPGRGASLDLERDKTIRSAALESEIVGVGVEIKAHDNGLLIMKALRGGPAAEAGLTSGDIITAINGRSIAGMPMANSVDLMKGTSGTKMQLRIVRNGSRGSDVTLTRRRVRIYTVNDARMLPNTEKVAYMSLSQFGQKSTEEMDQALGELYKSGMQSLVLDLRGNPGGLLNICVDITNRFLPCGTIVSTKGRLASDNMLETASYSRTWSTPLVVLVDGDSASASEIFAAAVQDNRRGIVVGEKSYGKGTVQTHFPLSSVSGNLRLTTARFYSPNGKAMSGEGVTPDVQVTDADGPANGDRMLEEAIKIAQSQRLKDIAQAAKSCRPRTGAVPAKNSAEKNDIMDIVAPKTVLR